MLSEMDFRCAEGGCRAADLRNNGFPVCGGLVIMED